jgi:predicted GNAT superfamily acetyltransferase
VDFAIEELRELEDLRELAELFALVWGRPGEPPISSDILRALAHSGNYLAGTRSGGRLIGGIVGWLGGHPPHDLHVHSHILGVVPGIEAQGLGFQLKQHQRRWCLDRSIGAVEWTFDPLVRRNAYFNLTKLGAEAERYLVDFYGTMNDGINAGDESDRILIRWELSSDKAMRAAAGMPVEAAVHDAAARVLAVGADGEPESTALHGPRALLQVPEDIVALRRSSPELARRWRHAVRAALGDAMAAGYRVTGVTREGWYVLQSGRG